MLYTKELVSGRDIDLTEYHLGVIKQPVVDDFMGEYDMMDFLKPFYLVRNWYVNDMFKEQDNPLQLFLVSMFKNKELDKLLMVALTLLYSTDEFELVDMDKGEFKILIKKDGKPIAVLEDANFGYLAKVVLTISYQDEPKKEKESTYEGDEELVELVKKMEREQAEKDKEKNALYFEEIVRRVVHMRNTTYDALKNLTLWQIQDIHRTSSYIANEELSWTLLANGCLKDKNIKKWQDETKLMREKRKE